MKILLLVTSLIFSVNDSFAQSMGPCEASVSSLKGYNELQPDIKEMALALGYLKDQGAITKIVSAEQQHLTRSTAAPCLDLAELKSFSDIGGGKLVVKSADGKDITMNWDANHVESMTRDKWLSGSPTGASNGHVGFINQLGKSGITVKVPVSTTPLSATGEIYQKNCYWVTRTTTDLMCEGVRKVPLCGTDSKQARGMCHGILSCKEFVIPGTSQKVSGLSEVACLTDSGVCNMGVGQCIDDPRISFVDTLSDPNQIKGLDDLQVKSSMEGK